ncbi:nucleotidyl transferase AbiEii/AbiGii toxin family protein [Megasphaera paucivorans]|uniref:Nucleotidyl transferase AbiEii toxin, Type IV TA system n=1 Tax=Megasphaera paucivorans TaxID=349095 RepID=A0A1G9W2Z5_9FIRM|nr:nucleotidyl transferase AbiEii/AbiGii toxin family protein [Megasphaera paucivorans]SDM78894.1 Nucleotidyl transferase AbiEii toxin, Type IV TA system [Megasphaera paucivorans]
MKLHEDAENFEALSRLTSAYIGIPETAVRRDYLIIMILEKLSRSAYRDQCVFKGGTSLSKCYPESIKRFSEDIDLTYLPEKGMSDKEINRQLKKIERILTSGLCKKSISAERSNSGPMSRFSTK